MNSAWIEEAIKVNSVHPDHSDAPFQQLHHYALLFHDEMLEALAGGIESRLVTGTMVAILENLAGSLIKEPYRVGLHDGLDTGLAVVTTCENGADPRHAPGYSAIEYPPFGVSANFLAIASCAGKTG